MTKKITYLGVIVLLISSIISCEKDFTDINSNIINNSQFSTNDSIFDITISPVNIEKIRTDNIEIGTANNELRYLLGVYKNNDYKKTEASLVTQVALASFFKNPGADTIRVIDNSFITMAFEATKKSEKETDGKPIFTIDNVIGETPENVAIKVYRNGTYLNSLNPLSPTENNKYFSNSSFAKLEELTRDADFKLSANPKDTMYVFHRFLTNTTTKKDTLKLSNSANPFLTIPLDSIKIKDILLDKNGASELSSQDAFNNYFRGLIIEATGESGAIIPFKFSGNSTPNINIYYSDVVYKNSVIDTIIRRSTKFPLTGIRTAMYKATNAVNPVPQNSIAIQGTIGSAGKIELFTNQQVQQLRAKNWLINDASLTFYVDATRDTTQVPKRLFLYKQKIVGNDTINSQIKDAYTEVDFFDGKLQLSNDKPQKYTIKITDYISDLLKANSDDEVTNLILKVYNGYTDNPIKGTTLDTVVKSYNWQPSMVTLLNHNETINGDKRAHFKISYSKRK